MTKKSPFYSAVSFRSALLDSYKKLHINEDELAVILVTDLLLEQGNPFVTADMLSMKMNLKPADIDHIMVDLVKRGFLSFDASEGGGMKASLDGLRTQVYAEFRKSIERSGSSVSSAGKADRLSLLGKFYETTLGRSLSPLEVETVGDWIEAGYSDEDIKNALLDAVREGKRTIRAVDKILRAKRMQSDLTKEGASAVSQNWDKDIDSTVAIVKGLWGSDGSKK